MDHIAEFAALGPRIAQATQGWAEEFSKVAAAANQAGCFLDSIAIREPDFSSYREASARVVMFPAQRTRILPVELIEDHLIARRQTRKEFAHAAGVSQRTFERALAGEPILAPKARAIMRQVRAPRVNS